MKTFSPGPGRAIWTCDYSDSVIPCNICCQMLAEFNTVTQIHCSILQRKFICQGDRRNLITKIERLKQIRPRGERIVLWWRNTNTNIIRLLKNDRIRIQILFGFPKMTEYEYEYYSVSQKWPNMNTNIIRFPKNDRIGIRIFFVYPEMIDCEYECHSASQ